MDFAKEKHALPNLCYIHTLKKRLPKESERFLSGHCNGREMTDIGLEKGHRRLIVTPTSASSIYITTVAQEQFSVYM